MTTTMTTVVTTNDDDVVRAKNKTTTTTTEVDAARDRTEETNDNDGEVIVLMVVLVVDVFVLVGVMEITKKNTERPKSASYDNETEPTRESARVPERERTTHAKLTFGVGGGVGKVPLSSASWRHPRSFPRYKSNGFHEKPPRHRDSVPVRPAPHPRSNQ